MDNKIFNINGRTKEQLAKVIELALFDEYGKHRTAMGWKVDSQKGLILLSYVGENKEGCNKFLSPLKHEQITNIVWEWLHSSIWDYSGIGTKETKIKDMFPMEGWDADAEHDGSNELGWRVYCEDWGHVGGESSAIVAIKPAYCWYGK